MVLSCSGSTRCAAVSFVLRRLWQRQLEDVVRFGFQVRRRILLRRTSSLCATLVVVTCIAALDMVHSIMAATLADTPRYVRSFEDANLALYRHRARRDTHTFHIQARKLAADAAHEMGITPREGEPPPECIVTIHYGWNCLRRLLQARKAGRCGLMVGSVLVPPGIPQSLALVARDASPLVYMVDQATFEGEFGCGVPWCVQPVSPGVSGFSEDSAASGASSSCRFSVACPVSQAIEQLLPPFLVLDSLGSCQNIGEILRTAFLLGLVSVVASRAAWRSINGRACSVSDGWLYHMDFHFADSLPETLREIRKLGIRIYAAENHHPQPVAPHKPLGDTRWALVVGHEEAGVSPEVAELSDAHICVPQRQGESLNVAHATAICLHELSRHMPV